MTWFSLVQSLFGEKLIYRTGSTFNPTLEVIWKRNHLQLDTRHVNYSFGELHKSFLQLFKKMDVGNLGPKNVLILGFGAGSVASILQNEYQLNCRITGIEIDSEVIALGRRFFSIDALAHLTIIEECAFTFMESNRHKYDLVIVDLYLDMDVPVQAETKEFTIQLKDALTEKGTLVFNKFVYNADTRQGANYLHKILNEHFGEVKRYKTGHDRMNRMFVCVNAN